VFARAEAGMAVFVLDGTRARLRTVQLGGRNGQQAWIRDGLREGETVLVYPPVELRDGDRVRVRIVASN
jgi:HlyD family secretion protein